MSTTKMTYEKFLERSLEKFGDVFDYDNKQFVNACSRLTIKCKVCGEVFERQASNHLSKDRCPGCYRRARSNNKFHGHIVNHNTIFEKEFRERIHSKHGDRFDLRNVDYKGWHTKTTFTCKDHGEFVRKPIDVFNSDHGCLVCAANYVKLSKTKPTTKFIQESVSVHGDKYDYTKCNYVNDTTFVSITCKKHGITFEQQAGSHITGCEGCPECKLEDIERRGLSLRYTTEEYLAKYGKLHDHYLDFSKTLFTKIKESVVVTCKEHGDFTIPAEYLTREHNVCPKCKKFGKAEHSVREFVESLGFETEKNRSTLEGKELDILVKGKNLAIEYNGLYWHSDAVSLNARIRHKHKTDLCADKGIRLMHIFEDDWINNRTVVENYIKRFLGVADERVFARKCEVVEIDKTQAKEFLVRNHIQGSSASQVDLGLTYNGELVAVMQFSNNTSVRGTVKDGFYELTRYATSKHVIGGASKLFKHFIKMFSPREVLSYSDDSLFTGEMYPKLGFRLDGFVPPDYKVIDRNVRKHKSNFRRDVMQKRFGDKFNPALSERDNCHALGFYRIYDCGKKRWIWNTTQEPTNV